VWRVSDDTLSIAQQENEAAIRRLRQCTSLGNWPTGYEEVRLFEAA
jgi:transcriptional regulator NrdR family protein